MGTDRHENHTLSLGFSRAGGGAPDTAAATVLLREQRPYLLVTRFQGHELLRRKVNSSPGPPTASPRSESGPTHPCSTAVHMEPFSVLQSSRFSLEYLLLPPKICTGGGSSRVRALTFYALRRDPPTPFSVSETLEKGPGMGSTLERHPFSGPVA
ncbi:uncharacterized protein TNCT_191081 [Trichonephila clavata]|uniref:Uncharacterized protein n=1 Tax=Trichonephila clavata TaxID=2740835 RepID=A0A8X6G771_TRICU|nr:uncharacterized protein TNCT_191081 [Trichonephila clavata]